MGNVQEKKHEWSNCPVGGFLVCLFTYIAIIVVLVLPARVAYLSMDEKLQEFQRELATNLERLAKIESTVWPDASVDYIISASPAWETKKAKK